MGYTHYLQYGECSQKEFEQGLEAALPLLKKICKEHRKVLCLEYDEPTKAPLLESKLVKFNGKGDDGHETFYIAYSSERHGFCKTARKPYDLAV